MRKHLIFSLLLPFMGNVLQAQTNPANMLRTDLISPSPTAAGITRYGEISVNQSSGANNFSIPLFNVAGNELSVPISLGYGFSGLKPAEPAGWVGLGWSLQAGGVITRNLKGRVDNPADANGFEGAYVRDKLFSGNTTPETPSFQAFLENVYGGIYDTEPDIYSFSFNGNSGRFIVYRGKCLVYPSQNIRVYDTGDAFLIVTADGTRYSFNARETTRTKASSNLQYNPPPYTSAWYLTGISNAAQTETISFLYSEQPEISQSGVQHQSYRKYENYIHGEFDQLSDITSSNYATFVRPQRLVAISSEKFSATFVAQGTPRTDVPTDYALDMVFINDRATNQTIRAFKFAYGYFGGMTLKLSSIEEKRDYALESTAVLSNIHRFEYENENEGFPDGTSLSLDHYGYYNGVNSSTLIPSTIYPSGANREPNASFAKYGALRKVTYPTGGYTLFEYEGNRAFDGRNYQTYPRIKTSHTDGYTGSFSADFVLDRAQTVTVDVVRERIGEPSGDGNIHGTKDFEIFRLEDGSFVSVAIGRLVLENENFPFTYTLPAGSYYIETYLDSRESSMSAIVNYNSLTNTPIEGKPVGGIRTRTITNVPLIGEPTVKSYGYTDRDGFSTGTGGGVVYDQSQFSEIRPEGAGFYASNSTIYNSFVAENSFTGVPDYYQSVTENINGPLEKFTTRSTYNMGGYFNAQPYPVATVQYKNVGTALQPIKKTTYEYMMVLDTAITAIRSNLVMEVSLSGGGVAWGYSGPLKEFGMENFLYQQGTQFPIGKRDVSYEGTDSLVTNTTYRYNFIGSDRLVSEKVDAADGTELVTVMKYAEDYVPGLSADFVSANVVAPVWEQQTWRRHGTADSVLVAASLTEYNSSFRPATIYALPVNGLSSLNNEGRTGLQYNYLRSDTRYEPRVNFSYNSAGRLVNQRLENGTSNGYQWGYGAPLLPGQYPIAEAKNAMPTEFYTENFEESTAATTGTGHTGEKYYMGDFVVNWAIPNARAYKLGYWYRDGIWRYQEQDYTGPATLGLGDAVDDVRIYPADAQLNTYTYRTGIGQSSVTDARAATTYYEYDELARLLNVRDQHGDIVKNYRYNQPTEGTIWYSAGLSGPFSRNSCSAGQFGRAVVFTMAPGTYSSAISQADADAQATSAFGTAGQAYANANGGCGVPVAFTAINTTNIGPDGKRSGRLAQLRFRDANGVALYTFNETAINAGFSVPQGTYTVEFTIDGQFFEFWQPYGWGSCSLKVGGITYGFDKTAMNYVFANVVLSGSTGKISLLGGELGEL